MRSAIRDRSLTLCAGALLALLLGGMVTPQAARAACARPHVSGSGMDHGLELFERLALEGQPAGGMTPALPAAPKAPAPCSGPTCSGNPGMPTAPMPAPVPPVQAEQWAFLASPPPLPGSRATLLAWDDCPLALPEDASRVFHPPRPR